MIDINNWTSWIEYTLANILSLVNLIVVDISINGTIIVWG